MKSSDVPTFLRTDDAIEMKNGLGDFSIDARAQFSSTFIFFPHLKRMLQIYLKTASSHNLFSI